MQNMTMTAARTPPARDDAGAHQARQSGWKNPWVISWIGLIVVVLGVNITMVVLAITTNPGLVRDDYYEGGRAVERSIQSRLAEGPHWTIQIDTPEDIHAEAPAKVRFAVVDKAGQPVRPDAVTYYVYRPSDAQRDFSLPMTAVGPGLFEVDVTFPLPGVWDTLVSVRHEDAEETFPQRVSVAEP
jgi:nitrogen fixation protein FixH